MTIDPSSTGAKKSHLPVPPHASAKGHDKEGKCKVYGLSSSVLASLGGVIASVTILVLGVLAFTGVLAFGPTLGFSFMIAGGIAFVLMLAALIPTAICSIKSCINAKHDGTFAKKTI